MQPDLRGCKRKKSLAWKKKAALAQQPCANVNKDMHISKVWDKIRRMNVSHKIPQEWVVLLREKTNLQELTVPVNQTEIRLGKGNVRKSSEG